MRLWKILLARQDQNKILFTLVVKSKLEDLKINPFLAYLIENGERDTGNSIYLYLDILKGIYFEYSF